MSADDRPLLWFLQRGLGRGLILLRQTDSDEASDAVAATCCQETRWDPDTEDRTFYLAKALAIIDDRDVEERILDRWERELPWQYRGPWSDVGLVLAGRGHLRAGELIEQEAAAEFAAMGPGPRAAPEGMTDVAEWLEAIRDDPRLRVGGGLRVAKLATPDDRPRIRAALTDDACPHLQEAAAVCYSRFVDGEARTWLIDHVETDVDERAYWWWQGLSGQAPCDRARSLAIAALRDDATSPAHLGWALKTLFANWRADDRSLLGDVIERAIRVKAEDAVSQGLDFISDRWDPAYAATLLHTLRYSSYGANRRDAIELARRYHVTIPADDLSDLLEDADAECRLVALELVDDATARARLVEIARGGGEDPAFLAAATARFTG
jgi:hypothetical protein